MNNFDDSTYYHYKLIFSSKISTKLKLLLSMLFISILAVSILALIQLYTFYQIPSLKTEVILLHIFCGCILAPIYHHLFHGIGFIRFGIYPKISLTDSFLIPIPKWSSTTMLIKRQQIFMLLTPLLLGTGVITLLMALFPDYWFIYAAIFAIHLSMSFIDVYWAFSIRNMHHAVVIRSAKHGFNVYKI